jgi:hypothetical protein
MAIDFSAVDFKCRLDVPKTGLIAILPAPCLRERSRAVDALVQSLGIKVLGSADVPYGFAVGGPDGQVEVFAASGAVRARNTEQLSRFNDERRPWADVTCERTKDGPVYGLGANTARRLQAHSERLLDASGLAVKPSGVRVAVGQWARLEESGKEVESGPGRATVQFAYAIEGIPLIGAGAKTNIHFDPDETGADGVIARFFHVHRGSEAAKDIRLLDIEQAFEPLLKQTWSGIECKSKHTCITITAAEFGLLALPADVPQRVAGPALRLEGTVSGLVPRDGREVSIRFGQYLSLVEPKWLAEAGFGSAGDIVPGQLVAGRGKGASESR